MKIILYGQSEAALAALGALKLAQYDVVHRTNKYFDPRSLESCDTVLIIECANAFQIAGAYLGKGIRAFILDRKPPVLPGYPVAVFESFNVGDYTMWGFLHHPTPDAYQNPEPGQLVCSFYPAGPLVIEERPKPTYQHITEVFHPKSLSEAPRVWIVGGGPSLKNFDWNLLSGEVVIGANRAFEMPNVGICVTIDPLFERLSVNGDLGHDQREAWRKYPGIKIYAAHNEEPRSHDVILAPRARKDDTMPPKLGNIGKASNSGYAALKVAWAMGAKKIYCLGFDMGGINGMQAWFHDGYPEVFTDSLYSEYREEMNAAAPHLAADGVEVTICGPTALTAFPTITLAEAADALSSKPLRPVVCGFYTRGTKYQQEAEAMARSAVAFGLDVSLVDVENLGDWKANTDQKPEAIRFALEHHDGAPIAFVDADARFRAYPEIFDYFTEGNWSLGLSYFDWDQFPNDPRTGKELSSAVMLLKAKCPVLTLLDDWIDSVKSGTGDWEQRVLQNLLANPKHNLPKIMELPMRYNQIFDDMSSLGLPVIEQMQASRRLKEEVAA